MKARLGFAVVSVLEPDILLVDEALAVGDLAFQRKCLSHVHSFLERGGVLVLVTHDPHLAASTCEGSLVLDQGRGVLGPVAEGVHAYMQIVRKLDQASRPRRDGAQPSPDVRASEGDWALDVVGVEIRPAQGERVESGRPALFCLRYAARVSVAAHFIVIVETEDGERVVISVGRTTGEPAIRLPVGESELHGAVEYLSLAPGRFQLRAYVLDAVTGVPFGNPARGYAEVHGTSSARVAMQALIRQLAVIPEPQWTVVPATNAGESHPGNL